MSRNLYPGAVAVYVNLLPGLREIARAHGYALAVHGSMLTDLDVVAVPWTEQATSGAVLVEALRAAVGGVVAELPQEWACKACKGKAIKCLHIDTNPSVRAHGRMAWAIHLGTEYKGPYIDVSVMPRAQVALYVERCPKCGAGDGAKRCCDRCNRYGWVWSDGVAPSKCVVNDLACGRSGATCPACKRTREEIDTVNDIAANIKRMARNREMPIDVDVVVVAEGDSCYDVGVSVGRSPAAHFKVRREDLVKGTAYVEALLDDEMPRAMAKARGKQ